MKKIELDEQKQILLKMLLFIDDFCTENGLRYSLGGGTLLGAIRHSGFIPWDDDVDIMMPRQDYEKFIASFNSSSQVLKCEDHSNVSDYSYPFAKIYHMGTILRECDSKEESHIFIDLFPIDAYPNRYWLRKVYIIAVTLLKALLYMKKVTWLRKGKLSLKRFMAKGISTFVPKAMLQFLIDKLAKFYLNSQTEWSGALLGRYSFKECYPNDVFESYIRVPFEKHELSVIEKYDSYLRQHYGNYLELPPISERRPMHVSYCYYKD